MRSASGAGHGARMTGAGNGARVTSGAVAGARAARDGGRDEKPRLPVRYRSNVGKARYLRNHVDVRKTKFDRYII